MNSRANESVRFPPGRTAAGELGRETSSLHISPHACAAEQPKTTCWGREHLSSLFPQITFTRGIQVCDQYPSPPSVSTNNTNPFQSFRIMIHTCVMVSSGTRRNYFFLPFSCFWNRLPAHSYVHVPWPPPDSSSGYTFRTMKERARPRKGRDRDVEGKHPGCRYPFFTVQIWVRLHFLVSVCTNQSTVTELHQMVLVHV